MTVEEEIFNKNVTKWHIFYPKQATLLNLPHKNIFEFYQNLDGSLNLKFKNRDTYFHALTNPQEEAQKWFETFNLKGKNTLIIFGVGLGYLYDAAKKWLRSNSTHQLIFVEPTLEVIQYLLKTERGTAILDDSQVWLTPMDVNEVVEISQPLLSTNAYLFVSLPIYEQNMAPLIQNFKSNLSFALKIKTDNLLEFVDRGYNFCSNYYRNLLLIPKAYFGGSLVGKFKDIPAIICGAGPSLAKSLPLLKELKDKALIFGGGTAMNGLNTSGLLPHFGVGIDPNPAQFTRLVMNQGFETPYFYRNRMSTKAVDFISDPDFFFRELLVMTLARFLKKS